MGRYIASVIVGYLAMVVAVFAGAMGVSKVAPDFALKTGTFEVTTNWLIFMIALSFVAAIIGGFVAVLVCRHRKAAKALAILTIALGLANAIGMAVKPKPTPDSVAEMLSKVEPPIGYSFALPFIGAAGVLLGGRITRVKNVT